MWPPLSQVIPQKCSKSYSLLCFKLDIIRYVNKISDKQETQLLPGLYLEKINNEGENKKPERNKKKKKQNPSDEISSTGNPEEQIKRYDRTDETSDNAEHLKRNENDADEETDMDQLDAQYYAHLLSQNKSGTWLSTELLDDSFLEYLIEKVDRYFQTRNLKVQIVESIKKIDQEVFGGILPSAETGERRMVILVRFI